MDLVQGLEPEQVRVLALSARTEETYFSGRDDRCTADL